MEASIRTKVKLKGKRFTVEQTADGKPLKVTYISAFSGEREVKLSSRTVAELVAIVASRSARPTP